MANFSILVHVLFLSVKRGPVDTNKRTPEPRIVVVKKSQVDLGIQICGGNLYGIFVSDVDDDSPAKGPDGLVLGDMILEVSTSEMSTVYWLMARMA